MRISICDTCQKRRETKGASPDGWEVYDSVVKCLNCRLGESETKIREITTMLDRMLDSDLIRKETCKSFRKDLDKLKPRLKDAVHAKSEGDKK